MRHASAVLLAVLIICACSGCSASGRGAAPPGQVQHETGYNPASGKVHKGK